MKWHRNDVRVLEEFNSFTRGQFNTWFPLLFQIRGRLLRHQTDVSGDFRPRLVADPESAEIREERGRVDRGRGRQLHHIVGQT